MSSGRKLKHFVGNSVLFVMFPSRNAHMISIVTKDCLIAVNIIIPTVKYNVVPT